MRDAKKSDSKAKVIPGLGDGSRVALEVIDALRREFPIDDGRIYVTGRSHGRHRSVEHHRGTSRNFRRRSALLWKRLHRKRHRIAGDATMGGFHGIPPIRQCRSSISRERIAALDAKREGITLHRIPRRRP